MPRPANVYAFLLRKAPGRGTVAVCAAANASERGNNQGGARIREAATSRVQRLARDGLATEPDK
jgi:hypothetical protein